jgi:hypothetical protein
MIFKPMIVYEPKLTEDTPRIYYEYIQQPEIIERLKNQLQELLKPYENREDIEIHLVKGTEHPASESDCLSIKLQIMVKPRKEIKYESSINVN